MSRKTRPAFRAAAALVLAVVTGLAGCSGARAILRGQSPEGGSPPRTGPFPQADRAWWERLGPGKLSVPDPPPPPPTRLGKAVALTTGAALNVLFNTGLDCLGEAVDQPVTGHHGEPHPAPAREDRNRAAGKGNAARDTDQDDPRRDRPAGAPQG
jgi:hypothetical protein